MSKKSASKTSILYLIGSVLAVVGFCVPIFKGKFLGSTANGFGFINFDNSVSTSIFALMVFVGACAGLLVALLSLLKVKISSARLLEIILILVSIAGGVILFITLKSNNVSSFIGKNFFTPYVGFYLLIAGWVCALVGAITNI